MELSRIKILVDKYFDGLTSLEEEQELARYFAETEDIPEEYQVVKMMLSSFCTLSNETPKAEVKAVAETKHRNIFRLNRKWIAGVAAAAAAILIGAMIILIPNDNGMETPIETTPDYVCYVNGVKVEDDQLAYAEASRLLGSISEDMQLAMAEVNRLTHYTIVK
jgi:hypothetical protein